MSGGVGRIGSVVDEGKMRTHCVWELSDGAGAAKEAATALLRGRGRQGPYGVQTGREEVAEQRQGVFVGLCGRGGGML